MKKTLIIMLLLISILILDGCKENTHTHVYENLQYDETIHYYECNECHEKYQQEEHHLTELSRINSTCEKKGEVIYSCICGYEEKELLPLVEHQFDEGKIKQEATVITKGIIVYTCKICSLEKEEFNNVISIKNAIDIGESLSSNKGTTEDEYTITGYVTSVSSKEITISDGENTIYGYMSVLPEYLYMDYKVTLQGKIQNYYGKIELVEFVIVNHEEAYYKININEINNGKIEINKTNNIKWGEIVTINVIPENKYKLVVLTINGINQSIENNSYEYKVESDLEISVRFVLVDTQIIELEKTYKISDYKLGTQYAIDEIHKLDENITVINSLCHWTSELRIYSSNTNNGVVIISAVNKIKSIKLNLGHSVDVLNVYGSIDGVNYELIKEIDVITTYKDYDVNMDSKQYKFIKLDVKGSKQIRLKYFTICTIGEQLVPSYIEVEDIDLGVSSLILEEGNKKTISPIIIPNNATNKELTFKSSNEDVATISVNGVITALKEGTTTITISTYQNLVEKSFILTVNKKELLEDEEYFNIFSVEMMGTYGDCNLIQYGDFDILIDGGTSSDSLYINDLLKSKVSDHIIEYLIISHPDTDHYEGLLSLEALESIIDIENIITNGNGDNQIILSILEKEYPNANYEIITDLVSQSSKVYDVKVGEEFQMNFLYQDNYINESSNKNNQSIVLTINYQNTILFMAGDLEENGCNSIMKYFPNLTTDENYVIFKALHHGSKYTNTTAFLQYLKPDMCFITTGMRLSEPNYIPNYNSHPYIESIIRIGELTNKVYWSSINGDLDITCDGETSIVEGIGRTTDYYYSIEKNSSEYYKASIEDECNVTFFESCYYLMARKLFNYPDFTE